MSKTATSKLIPQPILELLKEKACNQYDLDMGKSSYINCVAEALAVSANEKKRFEIWFRKTQRLYGQNRKANGGTKDTRDIIGKYLGYTNWNRLIKERFVEFDSLIDLTDELEKKNIKNITGTWVASYTEKEEDAKTMLYTNEIIKFKQVDCNVTGEGFTAEKNPDDRSRTFNHWGKVVLDLYSGDFARTYQGENPIWGRGNCLLKVDESCNIMKGHCTWFDEHENKIVISQYTFKKIK